VAAHDYARDRFTDEVSLSTANRIANAARTALAAVPALKVQFSEIVVAHQAIALLPQPPEPIRQLRTVTRIAIGRVLGNDRVPEDPDRFRPHVSIAYITADGPAAPYLTAVERIHPQPVNVPIGHVSLIELHRDRNMWERVTIDRLPLD
jgi:2'-5' RNA ligase